MFLTWIFYRREDTAAIRVSNLSENAQETDLQVETIANPNSNIVGLNHFLQELFKPFGHIARIFLAKDKMTGQCKVSLRDESCIETLVLIALNTNLTKFSGLCLC